jgi:hypothetical protein
LQKLDAKAGFLRKSILIFKFITKILPKVANILRTQSEKNVACKIELLEEKPVFQKEYV